MSSFPIHRVARGEEIAAAIDGAQASGAKALNILSSPLFYAHRHLIMERAAAAHLPTIYELPETAEEGGFAAYGPRNSQLFAEIMPRQIVKVLRGTKVADIPVEQATKFELVINLKTANAMGVTVPAPLVARADKVIEQGSARLAPQQLGDVGGDGPRLVFGAFNLRRVVGVSEKSGLEHAILPEEESSSSRLFASATRR
jgi:hypothetical protein